MVGPTPDRPTDALVLATFLLRAVPLFFAVTLGPVVLPQALTGSDVTTPPEGGAPFGTGAAGVTPAPPSSRAPATVLPRRPVEATAGTGAGAAQPSAVAGEAVTAASVGSIPPVVLSAYQDAARAADAETPGCNLTWTVLAGIGRLESGHARSGGSGTPGWNGVANPPILGPVLDGTAGNAAIRDTDGGALDGDPIWDRAVGPMQFLPGTWAAYGADADGDGVADPQNIRDATLAAGRYLCAGGGDLSDPAQLYVAVFSYNRADWYVRAVLAGAAGYARQGGGAPALPVSRAEPPAPARTAPPVSGAGPVRAALAFALARLGRPYQFGGTGPLYDCSGLTQAAYAAAGVGLPRTAEQQWTSLPRVTDGRLRPGDLVFSNPGEFLPGLPGHVGLYLGDGYMVDAPHPGAVIRVEPVAGFGTYVGAARPSLLLGATDRAGRPGAQPTPGAGQAPGRGRGPDGAPGRSGTTPGQAAGGGGPDGGAPPSVVPTPTPGPVPTAPDAGPATGGGDGPGDGQSAGPGDGQGAGDGTPGPSGLPVPPGTASPGWQLGLDGTAAVPLEMVTDGTARSASGAAVAPGANGLGVAVLLGSAAPPQLVALLADPAAVGRRLLLGTPSGTTAVTVTAVVPGTAPPQPPAGGLVLGWADGRGGWLVAAPSAR